MEILAEEWRDVAGQYQGLPYEVSSKGRVRKKTTKRILASHYNRDGYEHVSLLDKIARVHRVVAMAFVDGYEATLQVNHINGVKSDNRAINLEWVTSKENHRHARALGLITHYGRCVTQRKLSSENAAAIRSLTSRGVTHDFLSRWFGVSRSAIWKIVTRRTYIT